MECSAPTCNRPPTRETPDGSLCHHHYMSWRKWGHVGSKYPDTCTVEGCGNKHLTQGMCSGHYRRMRANGTTDWRPRKNTRARCSVDGCDLISFSKGMCQKHYTRVRRYGTVELPPPNKPDPKLCAQCGAERPPKRSTYCSDECRMRGDYHVRLATGRANQLRRYGLTLETYDALLTSQGGACAICGDTNPKNFRGRNESFSVDHDHVTGKVRGLLCLPCNSGLGHFKDDSKILEAAMHYLVSHSIDWVP